MANQIPCGDAWQDCPYFDPDICLDEGQCILEDAVLWNDDYDQEDSDVIADMMPERRR